MSSHLTMVASPYADFFCALAWIIEISSPSNDYEWGSLVTSASISSGVQSRPTETGHLTHAYCSKKIASGCCLILHLRNTKPFNFSLMTPFVLVNSSSNRRRLSANTVSDLFSCQYRGTLSLFGVGCTTAANALDSRFLLRLAPYRECTSDSCLKLSARNCVLAGRLKSIVLSRVVNCEILLRISLLTLLVLRLLSSKLSSTCSRVIQQFFLFYLFYLRSSGGSSSPSIHTPSSPPPPSSTMVS